MCGIAGIVGSGWEPGHLTAMVASQRHRGPDGEGFYIDPERLAGFGHNRLKIIDLSAAGRQPMSDSSGRYQIVFNGEIYNYLELRRELNVPFHSQTDTEVLLAAFDKWGENCLSRLLGMFAFAIWDEQTKTLFAARDRFGVKPFYYHKSIDGNLFFSSEIKALHAAGVAECPDEQSWSNYLVHGVSDSGDRTFWKNINALPAGHSLRWHSGQLNLSKWYDLADATGELLDTRPVEEVKEEYLALLKDSLKLRFRSDVPVGINLSGGLDSSTLLGVVHAVQGSDSDVKTFTFYTGDARYDELPWVEQMLAQTKHQLIPCKLSATDVPALCESVQYFQDEPFGGLPTLAYARLFEVACSEGVVVLLDGQGMDEQWAGYDYYKTASANRASVVQGTKERPVRPDCLTPEFREKAETLSHDWSFPDTLRNLQYRDVRVTKIPRALRFNDRVSMRSSTELREPFLDHRLFELALRQPAERKINNGVTKWTLRQITSDLLPAGITEAPKRPLQTPQREWLRGPLRDWANDHVRVALDSLGASWFDKRAVESALQTYIEGQGDNSFFIWQWISAGLMEKRTCLNTA